VAEERDLMRGQRRAPVRVRLTMFGETVDELGDVTDNTTTRVVLEGATFDPERIAESPRSAGPQTMLPATFNVPGLYRLGPDDTVEVLAPAAQDNPDPVVLELWDVDGGSAAWRDRTKIPVTRAAQQAVGA
jgi:hypothetical protein